jgi:tRNA A-37 threonylcarbamoyl transferase component Bud32
MKGKDVQKIKDEKSGQEYYLKKVNDHEKKFYEVIKDHQICPDFTFIEKDNEKFVKMKAYDMTLAYYIELNEIFDIQGLSDIIPSLNKKISQLHDLNILHVDLHCNNILIDPSYSKDGYDIRIIDFDLSRFVDDLCDEDFPDFASFLPNFVFKKCWKLQEKINYLLQYEYHMWKLDYF